jgi:hypothetical protein
MARLIHTEINQGVDHRVHRAPTQRKQEATRSWVRFTRIDAIESRVLIWIDAVPSVKRALSLRSVTELPPLERTRVKRLGLM